MKLMSLRGLWEDPESDEDEEDDEASEAGNGKVIQNFLVFPMGIFHKITDFLATASTLWLHLVDNGSHFSTLKRNLYKYVPKTGLIFEFFYFPIKS